MIARFTGNACWSGPSLRSRHPADRRSQSCPGLRLSACRATCGRRRGRCLIVLARSPTQRCDCRHKLPCRVGRRRHHAKLWRSKRSSSRPFQQMACRTAAGSIRFQHHVGATRCHQGAVSQWLGISRSSPASTPCSTSLEKRPDLVAVPPGRPSRSSSPAGPLQICPMWIRCRSESPRPPVAKRRSMHWVCSPIGCRVRPHVHDFDGCAVGSRPRALSSVAAIATSARHRTFLDSSRPSIMTRPRVVRIDEAVRSSACGMLTARASHLGSA